MGAFHRHAVTTKPVKNAAEHPSKTASTVPAFVPALPSFLALYAFWTYEVEGPQVTNLLKNRALGRTSRKDLVGFQDRCLQPLGHLSRCRTIAEAAPRSQPISAQNQAALRAICSASANISFSRWAAAGPFSASRHIASATR